MQKRENADVYTLIRGHRIGGTEAAELMPSSGKECEWLEIFSYARATTDPKGRTSKGIDPTYKPNCAG